MPRVQFSLDARRFAAVAGSGENGGNIFSLSPQEGGK